MGEEIHAAAILKILALRAREEVVTQSLQIERGLEAKQSRSHGMWLIFWANADRKGRGFVNAWEFFLDEGEAFMDFYQHVIILAAYAGLWKFLALLWDSQGK